MIVANRIVVNLRVGLGVLSVFELAQVFLIPVRVVLIAHVNFLPVLDETLERQITIRMFDHDFPGLV